jgi:hypothetical protein
MVTVLPKKVEKLLKYSILLYEDRSLLRWALK